MKTYFKQTASIGPNIGIFLTEEDLIAKCQLLIQLRPGHGVATIFHGDMVMSILNYNDVIILVCITVLVDY